MPPGRLPREVFQAYPTGRRLLGRPRTRWRDYVSQLAWERLGGSPRKSWRKCLGLFLTWRDVQHLLVKTSRPVHLKADDWKTNGAGHRVSHLYGFGLVDAEAMVLEATKWRTVPPQHTCSQIPERHARYIHAGQSLNSSSTSSGCSEEPDQHVVYLEHVVVKVLIVHPRRGDLEINLISPSGTRSQLLARRLFDSSNEGFRNWEFMTVHFWGERAEGTWTLEIVDTQSTLRNPEVLGNLKEWTLILYGTSQNPYQPYSSQQSHSRMSEIPAPQEEPELDEEEEDEYIGPCHSECGDQGCDGPDPDHCLNCIHFNLGSLKSGRTCVSHCPLGHYEDIASRRCKRCYKGCERCVGRSVSDCLSCRKGLYLSTLNSSCINTCHPDYFADENQRLCLKCHDTCPGPGKEECIQCADGYLQQGWRCVQTCTPGYYAGEATGVPHKMCYRCEENCLSCSGSGRTCTKCKEGYSLVSRTCIMNASCNNADEVFCEMVRSNRLCEKTLYRQFCCHTCLMNG
ncbi:hypothetical protein L3Q82_000381 [Scortum barcoo]|uniref:Uncharacterized protein n=1 Tax=Scortum barcoo TaxID=214431 RepID=A0ACB8X8Y6_9TELE|nr:hypothetical protein L3Q82_000381 [Scortum barcoo]